MGDCQASSHFSVARQNDRGKQLQTHLSCLRAYSSIFILRTRSLMRLSWPRRSPCRKAILACGDGVQSSSQSCTPVSAGSLSNIQWPGPKLIPRVHMNTLFTLRQHKTLHHLYNEVYPSQCLVRLLWTGTATSVVFEQWLTEVVAWPPVAALAHTNHSPQSLTQHPSTPASHPPAALLSPPPSWLSPSRTGSTRV